MAEAVADACEQPTSFNFVYEDSDPIDVKIEKIATRIYRADGRRLPAGRAPEDRAVHPRRSDRALDLHGQDAPVAVGRPGPGQRSHRLPHPRRDIRPYTGAGFLTALCGDIMQMPGLGKTPAGSTSTSTRTARRSDSSSAPHDDPYLSSTVAGLLDDLAERTPAPGGGAAAALTCAMAAALVEMATSFASAHGLEAVRDRAHEIRGRVSLLAHADGEAYGEVLEALRMEPGEQRTQRLDEAVSGAIGVPMEVLELASEVAMLAADVAETGNRNLEGDALAGSLLAEAAARSAATLAQLNATCCPATPSPRRTWSGSAPRWPGPPAHGSAR